jgi:hypothetical protein
MIVVYQIFFYYVSFINMVCINQYYEWLPNRYNIAVLQNGKIMQSSALLVLTTYQFVLQNCVAVK